MGNKFAYTQQHDDDDSKFKLIPEFFRSLQLKWLEYAFAQIKEGISPTSFVIGNDKLSLSWKLYFKTFTEIKNTIDKDKETYIRSSWHPAVQGYIMDKSDFVEEEIEATYTGTSHDKDSAIDDDYTEDDASEISEQEESERDKTSPTNSFIENTGSGKSEANEVNKSSDRSRSNKWDSSKTSPIFFGYSKKTVSQHDDEVQKVADDLKTQEKRAIETAKSYRIDNLDNLEISTKAKESSRLNKMTELEKKYEASRLRRQDDFNRSKKELTSTSFRVFQTQWTNDGKAADAAFAKEMSEMKSTHEIKVYADKVMIEQKRLEIEALRDIDSQDFPSADKLEDLAKVEICQWVDESDKRGVALENARLNFNDLKEELQRKVSNGVNKSNQKQVMELRSILNIAETEVRTNQKIVQEAMDNLIDAEALLRCANRVRRQQDEILPIFKLLSHTETPNQCRLDLFACSMILAMTANFDKKLNFFLRLFDCENVEGIYTLQFVTSLVFLFSKTMYMLQLIPDMPMKTDIENAIYRGFQDLGVNPLKDILTEYEIRKLLFILTSYNDNICKTLGIYDISGSSYSTYQRNGMSVIALLSRGMINISTARYRLHRDATIYYPALDPGRKLVIHERAMAMGDDDPLRPDYSRYVIALGKTSKSLIIPLSHGHLSNSSYVNMQIKIKAAIVIQGLIRSHRARKIAELAAKYQAFMEAKEMALKEMKATIIREFKKREASTGMGKMKWDAQVRMKQAKSRASGQNIDRSDAVMLMIEEAISAAKLDLDAKFKVLEDKEDFAGIDFGRVPETSDTIDGQTSDTFFDVGSLFGIILKPVAQDDISLPDGISTPRDNGDIPTDGDEGPTTQNTSTVIAIESTRTRQMIEGRYNKDPDERGETANETDLRLTLSSAEPPVPYFHSRLRSLHRAMTEYKVLALLTEIPTKRLFAKYIHYLPQEMLITELKDHFQFKRDTIDSVITSLRLVFSTDMEQGIYPEELRKFRLQIEAGLRNMVMDNSKQAFDVLTALVNRKLSTSESAREVTIIDQELDRSNQMLTKYRSNLFEAVQSMDRLKDRFKRTLLSTLEIERKHRYVDSYKKSRIYGIHEELETSIDERQNWMSRLKFAFNRPSENIDDVENIAKYSEIRSVCREFIDTATADAIIIVSEHFQPKYRKTFPVVSETRVHGRYAVCGRGFDGGVYYRYEAHNISYFVSEDNNGVFNGSDEFAAKAAGKERLGALEFLKVHCPKLNTPLIATIDYHGYRVLAMSKLPIDIVHYSDEGEVRKISEDFIYGIQNDGDSFLSRNKTFEKMLKVVSSKLNLAEHECKGSKDISASKTFVSSEIKGYRGGDDEYYVRDFWRCFPPECPLSTPHLLRSPRDQSIFWRQLRPEFCRNYAVPLSPDAFSLIINTARDKKTQEVEVEKASHYLIKEVIPEFVEYLIDKVYILPLSEGLGLDITKEMHSRGINVRHIGLIRSVLWRILPGRSTIYFNEQIIRTSRDLREEVSIGDKIKINDIVYTIKEGEGGLKLTSSHIPIDSKYFGMSVNGIDAYSGNTTQSESNSDSLRTVLLAEMVARTLKAIVRLQLRSYCKKSQTTSSQFIASLVVEYMNMITGASANANEFLMECVYSGIRERFGNSSIRPSERINFQHIIAPCIVYIIKRFQRMLGIQLSITCLSEFYDRPLGFSFCAVDVIEVTPLIKHNLPIMTFADAMLTTLKARLAEKNTYINQVLTDEPPLFLRLSERKGARVAENLGRLSIQSAKTRAEKIKKSSIVDGAISFGCELEQAGPVSSDPFCRSILFSPIKKSYIDSKFHQAIVSQHIHQHFSVELFVKCTGSADTTRTVFMSGRLSLVASRDNFYTVTFMERMHELSVKLIKIELDKWIHVCITYDGSILRIYVDCIEKVSLEIEPAMQARVLYYERDLAFKRKSIDDSEALERKIVKTKTQEFAEKFFQTKEGVSAMKKTAQSVMESQEFQAENYGDDARDEASSLKARRLEALKQAKTQYITDLYVKNIREIAERCRGIRNDLEDLTTKTLEEGLERSKKGVRIGSIVTSSSLKEGANFFHGYISCFSVYNKCLSSDRVREHYWAAAHDKTMDAQRLHAIASSKYEEALLHASEDLAILRGYAKSLCDYLNIELAGSNGTVRNGNGISRGKLKVIEAIEEFLARRIPEGIAEILMSLPRDSEFANIVVCGYQAIKFLDNDFFMGEMSMSRKDLVDIPRVYSLDYPGNPQECIDCASEIFKDVSRDSHLCFAYGEVDLGWLPEVKCSELVIALVKYASEDKNLNFLKVGEMFKAAGRDTVNITDDDVAALSRNLLLTVGFDLSGSFQLTNISLSHISRMKNIRVLNLDGCIQITDPGLSHLSVFANQLEVLSLANIAMLSDESLIPLFTSCRNLSVVNLNNCCNVTHDAIYAMVKCNRRLSSLGIAGTNITDDGLSLISTSLSPSLFTGLDVSFCKNVTDFGILSLAEYCTSLTSLNMSSIGRISDVGIRNICSRCWYLNNLNLEDMYLLDDKAFWFSQSYDGRPAADEHMLKSLVVLNLKDCVNITDHAITGLAERCRKVEHLVLKGCDKLTNRSLTVMTEVFMDNVAMCDSIKRLDLSYCGTLSAEGILKLLPHCGVLEEINLSGISTVNDDFIHSMCKYCRTIQRLTLQKCIFLTDVGLCSMADFLWVEYLDVSGCLRISDEGIEILSMACSGIQELHVRRLPKLTVHALQALERNCRDLRRLDIKDCALIKSEDIKIISHSRKLLQIKF